MKKIYALTFSLIFSIMVSNATTWLVGASHTYIKPSQVSSLVQNGDTVAIDAGTYTADVCSWNKNNLVLKGVGGLAHLDANNTSYGRKGIWVISGNDVTVQNMEFSNCHDVAALDQNWAGIRMEGINLTVNNCYFHDNDDGILESNIATSNIVITYTEFNHNGWGDGYSHNLYIGHCSSLTFSYNYSHMAHIGHELKSRATTNYVLYNRFSNETGDASLEVSFPNGGLAVVMGNMIEQGPNSQNSGIVDYGSEGNTNPIPRELYLVNNTIVDDRSAGTFVQYGTGASLLKAYNNLITGPGTAFNGTATTVDTSKNLIIPNKANAGLVDVTNFDYHLLSSAIAINKGVSAGTTLEAFNLTPAYEYVHKTNKAGRITNGAIDIGAYEYSSATGIENISPAIEFYVYSDVNDNSINLFFTNLQADKDVYIYDMTGKLMLSKERVASAKISFSRSSFAPGIYVVQAKVGNSVVSKKFVVQ